MEELSLHILDIVENSIAAKADRIEIRIKENNDRDLLSIEVIDNGIGMDKETVRKALDPFYTTKKVRRFGLGLPLLSEAARAANGYLTVTSGIREGTRIKAEFQRSHIDRQPLGDIGQTLEALVIGNPEIDLVFVHKKNNQSFRFDTRKLKARLKNAPINSLAGIRLVKEDLRKLKNRLDI